MGPGETKQGLKKRIGKSKTMALTIADLHPLDKMTDNQISDRVRAFFKTGWRLCQAIEHRQKRRKGVKK
jgi:hypothetical protein